MNTCAFCTTGTINKKAYAQYMAVFSRVTASVPRDAGFCNCVAVFQPCCRSGTCTQRCDGQR